MARAGTGHEPWAEHEEAAPPLQVLVVDHRRAFREALAVRLAAEPDVVVVGAAGSFEAAEAALGELGPTVATVALGMGDDGLVLVTRSRRSRPPVRWVVVGSERDRPVDVADAIVAGASGFITMRASAATLALALRAALDGLSVTPEDLLREALHQVEQPPRDDEGDRPGTLDLR